MIQFYFVANQIIKKYNIFYFLNKTKIKTYLKKSMMTKI
jgi:hypothetical protein